MADKSKIEQLREIISESTWHSWHGEWMKAPFRCGGYVCVTDGHFLVGIEDSEADVSAMPATPQNLTTVPGLLATELGKDEFVLDHLQAWSDREKPACNICGGSGKQDCDDCGGKGCCTCGQSGQVDCVCHFAIPAGLFGKVVNILLVHRAVKIFSGVFQVGGKEDKQTPLVLGGEGWKAAIMPMRLPPNETYKPKIAAARGASQ